MQTEIVEKRGYRLVRFLSDIRITHDPAEIRRPVLESIEEGDTNIAISFTKDSFLSSRVVAVLLSLCNTLNIRGGRLTVILPNEKMLDVFHILNIAHDNCFSIITSEEALSARS